MSWPSHMVATHRYRLITYIDGERIGTEINPPSYRFFGVDAKGNGIYRRFNDARSRLKDGEFVSIPYHNLHRYEVIA